MTNLYTEAGLQEIEKNKKLHLFLMLAFIVLTIVSFVVFVVLATYKSRTFFSILCSVTTTSFALVSTFFLAKYFHIKRVLYEYSYLLSSTSTIVKGKIIKCSDFLTTLPDRSQCYEVLVSKDDKEVIYYLSALFDDIKLKEENVKLVVFQDYIKGYEYED